MSPTKVTIESPMDMGPAASCGMSEMVRTLTDQGYVVTKHQPDYTITVRAGLDEPPESYIIERQQRDRQPSQPGQS